MRKGKGMRMTTADLISNQAMVRCMSKADRDALGAQTLGEVQEAYDCATEAALQRQCEAWLPLHGYHKLTTGKAAAEALEQASHAKTATEGAKRLESPPRGLAGWFAHLPRAEKQPFLPDLVVFSNLWTRCLAIELKKPTGAPTYRPGQREMVDSGRWTLVRNLDDLTAAVIAWEALREAASLMTWQAGVNKQQEGEQ